MSILHKCNYPQVMCDMCGDTCDGYLGNAYKNQPARIVPAIGWNARIEEGGRFPNIRHYERHYCKSCSTVKGI